MGARTVDTILVVDDMPDFRILVKQILTLQGYTVKEASSGAEAITIISASPEIRLVLLDIGLPDADGFTVMKAIQNIRETRPNLKVAFVTGSHDKNDVIKGLAMKVDDYIIKPIDPVLLKEKVAKILNVENEDAKFAEVECDFSASLIEIPISFSFHIRGISEIGCQCESLNKFIAGSSFAFQCQKMEEVIGMNGYIFRARVDECKALAKTSDRFVTNASFVGVPEQILRKIRNFAMTFANKK
jgi:CheY-like chemotaxis protein